MPLLPLDDARAYVFDACRPLAPVVLGLSDALGRVAAETVTATEAVPSFDNSAMDGFAVRAADTEGPPVILEVVGTLAAGDAPSLVVKPGQAVRIMTGAALPAGADAVVMVERSAPLDSGRAVEIQIRVAPGTAWRRAGDDISPGTVVVEAGTVLSPGYLGVLASLSVDELSVFPPARVGVLSTGDELVSGPAPLRPGQIRDSNRPTLTALVRQCGCEAVDLGTVADDEVAITRAFAEATAQCDAVVTSGGVSMGDFDLVKIVLEHMGDMRWMQLAIKPAKPFAFGVVSATPVFGLPGNPVSSMVSFELLARPALRKMMGFPAHQWVRASVTAVADEALERRPDGKVHFVRAVATMGEDGRYRVVSAGGQGSHQLSAMAGANALAVLDDGDGVAAGAAVPVMLLDGS
ncbi:MAG: molybdopterin molybdotransferase MoeA [Acidimicrobiales bacterium]